MAAPFAERIRHKLQRQQAQQGDPGPAKEVYPKRSSSEHLRELGPEYVAHVFWEQLHCDRMLQRQGLSERQCRLAEIQVVGRLVAPRSERGTVGWFARTALAELMPGSVHTVNKDRLYRISDKLYEHRVAIEAELAARERELFTLQETIYFEGLAANNGKAARGYSRDHRPDRKQVVGRSGAGWRRLSQGARGVQGHHQRRDHHGADARQPGPPDQCSERGGGATVVMDRGLATDENLAVLRKRGQHYIVTTEQSQRRFPPAQLVSAGAVDRGRGQNDAHRAYPGGHFVQPALELETGLNRTSDAGGDLDENVVLIMDHDLELLAGDGALLDTDPQGLLQERHHGPSEQAFEAECPIVTTVRSPTCGQNRRTGPQPRNGTE